MLPRFFFVQNLYVVLCRGVLNQRLPEMGCVA